MRVAKAITISNDERKTLEKWSRGRSTPARLILRAKIVLAAAAGKLNKDIAAEFGTGMKTVCLWRNRFAKSGLAGIERDAPRGGRPVKSAAQAAETKSSPKSAAPEPSSIKPQQLETLH